MSSVFLKKNEERRVRAGHLWIFSNEIEKTEGNPNKGDIVSVYDNKKNEIGNGFYNNNSLIAVRLLSSKYKGDVESYISESLNDAMNLRYITYPDRTSYRACFSESDYLPGLIIDRYNDTYVMQVYSAGLEINIKFAVETLINSFNAKNIFSINDMYFRKLEGIDEIDTIYHGEKSNEIISDGRIKYHIDFNEAQKTGFYFDQSDNRYFVSKFAKDKRVLDCFCNHGGFGLHCAKENAREITFVDSSEIQINNAKRNTELNNLDTVAKFKTTDVFDYLESCINNNIKFDIVNIDPPAFAKNKRSVPAALKGYEKLNKLAMKCVEPGGLLASSSCSHHVDKDSFLNAINKAASKSNIQLQLIHFNTASSDHPSLISMPETTYLKFCIFRKIN